MLQQGKEIRTGTELIGSPASSSSSCLVPTLSKCLTHFLNQFLGIQVFIYTSQYLLEPMSPPPPKYVPLRHVSRINDPCKHVSRAHVSFTLMYLASMSLPHAPRTTIEFTASRSHQKRKRSALFAASRNLHEPLPN